MFVKSYEESTTITDSRKSMFIKSWGEWNCHKNSRKPVFVKSYATTITESRISMFVKRWGLKHYHHRLLEINVFYSYRISSAIFDYLRKDKGEDMHLDVWISGGRLLQSVLIVAGHSPLFFWFLSNFQRMKRVVVASFRWWLHAAKFLWTWSCF